MEFHITVDRVSYFYYFLATGSQQALGFFQLRVTFL